MTHPFDTISEESLRARGSLKWTLHGERSLGAFVAEMDFGTAPPIMEALRAGVESMAFGYLPPALVDELAQVFAGWQAERHGWAVSANDVRLLPDVVRGFELAIEHFSRPGSPIVLPTPAYMPFLTVPAGLGREVIEVPMVGRSMDLDGLDAAFRAGGDLLVLTNPHNPLGRVYSAAELAAVSEVVERNGARVFADEIHAPLVYPGRRHVPYASVSPVAAGHALTATSASKAWNLPGLKCAQLILSNDADRQKWADLGPFAGHGASTLGVLANTVAYREGGPWLAEVLEYLDGSRAYLAELLADTGVGYTPPEGTYLAWLDLRALDLGDHPGTVLHERTGVVLTDGPECGVVGAGHARLNFATPRPILARIVQSLPRESR